MGEISRRTLLKRGSVGVAGAVGVLAVPGVARAAARIDDAELTDAERAALARPFVLHLRDVDTGELELLVDEKSIVFRDKRLAARLLRATR
ncbi:MAG TPA: twin-arginine translocation signal domain-containing protein [Acidimicrobiales bacterium]|nr:twin-arginine translocation signal domain-containing protein [Acidimicrobiales bacterium]